MLSPKANFPKRLGKCSTTAELEPVVLVDKHHLNAGNSRRNNRNCALLGGGLENQTGISSRLGKNATVQTLGNNFNRTTGSSELSSKRSSTNRALMTET